jgi:hypothetical protein
VATVTAAAAGVLIDKILQASLRSMVTVPQTSPDSESGYRRFPTCVPCIFRTPPAFRAGFSGNSLTFAVRLFFAQVIHMDSLCPSSRGRMKAKKTNYEPESISRLRGSPRPVQVSGFRNPAESSPPAPGKTR